MKIKRLNSRGDTIVEVLICIAVLALIVAAAYTLTGRNQLTSQQAQERSEALKLASTQLELLRAYAEENSLVALKGKHFCLMSASSVKELTTAPKVSVTADGATVYPAECQSGTGNRYKIAVWGYEISDDVNALNSDKSVLAVTVRWDSVKGGSREEVKTFYTTYDSTTGGAPTSPGPGPTGPTSSITALPPGLLLTGQSTTITWNTSLGATNCETTNFPPGQASFDPRPALTGSFSTGPLSNGTHTYTIKCSNGLGTTGNTDTATVQVINPLPSTATISPNPGNFPAWHMYAATGTRKKITFTVKNPAGSPSPLIVNSVSITGTHATSFNIVSNGCNSPLSAGGPGCDIVVDFFPPSGPTYNRLSYAGVKTATLVVDTNAATNTTATLNGKAVTDRLVPEEVLSKGQSLRGYSTTCYSDADNCPNHLDMQTDGNLVLYISGWPAWHTNTCPTCANPPGYGSHAYMQWTGNFMLLDAVGTPLYTTLWYTPNTPDNWVWVDSNSGALRLMTKPFGSSNTQQYKIGGP